jgi:vacuolar protein sorting-associated protein 13A/C
VSLENNNTIFALLALPSADVAILLRAGTLRVSARLGNLSIEDLTAIPVADPAFKKLLTIEGGELADFSYETFDPNEAETFPGYNSSIHLRAGSFRFTFMEQPVQALYAWAIRFAQMKAVYDAASQAAVQRASEVTKMHYDVVVKTPIIVLPRDGLESPDQLVLRLGEIVAKNEYLGDVNDTATIDASLRGINVQSVLTVEGEKAALQMVNEVSISSKIKQAGGQQHRSDQNRADTEVCTNF